jgi:hypothetical protein
MMPHPRFTDCSLISCALDAAPVAPSACPPPKGKLTQWVLAPVAPDVGRHIRVLLPPAARPVCSTQLCQCLKHSLHTQVAHVVQGGCLQGLWVRQQPCVRVCVCFWGGGLFFGCEKWRVCSWNEGVDVGVRSS